MATNAYCTVAELKARLGETNTADDTVLDAVVTAVSRQIDNLVGRVFFTASDVRYFSHEGGRVLQLPFDLLAVATFATDIGGLRTYPTVWTVSTDYDLAPYDAANEQKPYTRIEVAPFSRWWIPTYPKAVKIDGTWGYWTAVPDAIHEACLIQAARIFRRKDSPFGVAGSSAIGEAILLTKMDPDVQLLLGPFRRFSGGAV